MAGYWFIIGPLVVASLAMWFVLVRMVGERER